MISIIQKENYLIKLRQKEHPMNFKSRDLLLAATLFAIGGLANATSFFVTGTTIQVYAQSKIDSTAYMIQSSKGIYQGMEHPWCKNRAYIDIGDTALYATALSAAMAGKTVSFSYDDAAPSRFIASHQSSTCRVISIFF